MSLETALRGVIEPLCGYVFPDEAQARTPLPYVVWQQIGGRVTTYVDDSVPATENAFVQVSVWASSRVEANALMRRIEAAMTVAQAFTARPMSAMGALPSDDEELRGVSMDFDVWMRR